jgi:hypothetical protein
VKGRGVLVLAVLGVFAVAAILAGCGGDSSTNASATDTSSESTASEQPSGPLTKAEFLKQANLVCRKGVVKKDEAIQSLAKLAAEAGETPSAAAEEKLVKVVVFPTYSEIIDQLAQLEAPQADQPKVEKMIQDYESDLEVAEAEPTKAIQQNLFKDGNDAGEAYGLESCHL